MAFGGGFNEIAIGRLGIHANVVGETKFFDNIPTGFAVGFD
jgi:hypothetical protein